MVIYADILFLVNLYVDALLLTLVRRFLGLTLSTKRWLLAAALGGAFGFTALLPSLPGGVLLLLGLLEAALLTAAAFAPLTWQMLLKAAFSLFLFAAALSGLLALVPFQGVLVSNTAVYYPLSAPLLIGLTCLAYGALRVFTRLSGERAPEVFFAKVEITHGGKTAALTAKLDTGLTLTEPFSGLPILVAEKKALGEILPQGFGGVTFGETNAEDTAGAPGALPNPTNFRLVPFSSLGGSGVLPAFRPDRVEVEGREASCWLAVSERPLSAGQFAALFGPQLNIHKEKIA